MTSTCMHVCNNCDIIHITNTRSGDMIFKKKIVDAHY